MEFITSSPVEDQVGFLDRIDGVWFQWLPYVMALAVLVGLFDYWRERRRERRARRIRSTLTERAIGSPPGERS